MKFKFLILFFFISICNLFFSQKFYKDKHTLLQNLDKKGVIYVQDDNNSNIYYVTIVDPYGESLTKLIFSEYYLQKVIFMQLDNDATVPLKRLKNIYSQATSQEADTFDPPSNGYGSGIASGTRYYDGKAKYECINNYYKKDFWFVITILD